MGIYCVSQDWGNEDGEGHVIAWEQEVRDCASRLSPNRRQSLPPLLLFFLPSGGNGFRPFSFQTSSFHSQLMPGQEFGDSPWFKEFSLFLEITHFIA